jgi:hypothetical protein
MQNPVVVGNTGSEYREAVHDTQNGNQPTNTTMQKLQTQRWEQLCYLEPDDGRLKTAFDISQASSS